jgi:mono/diheme cytochrome c family protein
LKARRNLESSLAAVAGIAFALVSGLEAQNSSFHNAPASAQQLKNPYAGHNLALGKQFYELQCASCHGETGEGSGNVPSLAAGQLKSVTSGEVFWFITKGDVDNGMPSWASLPEQRRWQIVTYVKSLGQLQTREPGSESAAAAEAMSPNHAPPPPAPFTDYRFESPGKFRKITVQDIPAPFATKSAPNGPKVVARPEGSWPQVPTGFRVQQYTAGLEDPRLIRTAPNGDFFVA